MAPLVSSKVYALYRIVTFAASLSERRRYCGTRHFCVSVCVSAEPRLHARRISLGGEVNGNPVLSGYRRSPYIVAMWNVVFANKSRKLGWIWMKLGSWGWGLKRLSLIARFQRNRAMGFGDSAKQEAQLTLRNRATATYFFVAKLISIAHSGL